MGTVRLEAAAEPYRISKPLGIPRGVSLVGSGPGTRLVATTEGATSLITIDAMTPGNRLGTVADLTLDGNGLSRIGLDLGLAVQRSFERLDITGCRQTGLRLRGSQNNLFLGVNVERNGTDARQGEDAGVVVAAGAGNNSFLRCELNLNGGYQLLIGGPGSPPDAFSAGPTGNLFLSCVLERAQPNTNAAVFAGPSRMNAFVRCDITHRRDTLIEVSSRAHPTMLWRFYACALSGSADRSVVLRGAGAWGWTFDGCLLENFAKFAELGPGDDVTVLDSNQVSAVGNWDLQNAAYGPRSKVGGSAWNERHLVMGQYHLWVDSQGQLRMKRGAPTRDDDGKAL
jgi:hypothetical protein